MKELSLSSPCFEEGGLSPTEHTGYGEDRSPELVLTGLCEGAVTLALLLDDLDHPVPAYNHWVVWNIPPAARLPGGLPGGGAVGPLGQAVQGVGYGKNRYRGPKPPFRWSHRYRFRVFALDCRLELPPTARKRQLLAAIRGHILQEAALTGHFR